MAAANNILVIWLRKPVLLSRVIYIIIISIALSPNNIGSPPLLPHLPFHSIARIFFTYANHPRIPLCNTHRTTCFSFSPTMSLSLPTSLLPLKHAPKPSRSILSYYLLTVRPTRILVSWSFLVTQLDEHRGILISVTLSSFVLFSCLLLNILIRIQRCGSRRRLIIQSTFNLIYWNPFITLNTWRFSPLHSIFHILFVSVFL